jgi:hypothetical protein
MSRRGKRNWTSLDDGLTDEQLAYLIESATDWLITKAADLPPAYDGEEWKTEAEEASALGRLVTGLRRGEILPEDAVARKIAARSTSERHTLDELRKEYRQELSEIEAWAALLARFDIAAGGER